MSEFGTLVDAQSVRFERRLSHRIERVWAFLTDPALRSQWLAAGEMALRPGGRLKMTFDNTRLGGGDGEMLFEGAQPQSRTFTGRVLRCEEPRILSHTWDEEDGTESEVTYELVADGEHTLLIVTHRRLASASLRTDVAAGWHAHLNVLGEILDGRPPASFGEAHAKYKEHYARQMP